MIEQWPESGNVRCEDLEETHAFGERFGATLRAGDVVILNGPLGAGKTALTQGIARGMKVKGRVTSPTFTIARVHRSMVGGPDLIHMDAYRLLGEDPDADVDAVGALDSLDLDTERDNSVVVAEWGAGFVEQIADQWWLVTIDRHTAAEEDPDSSARIIMWQRCHPEPSSRYSSHPGSGASRGAVDHGR